MIGRLIYTVIKVEKHSFEAAVDNGPFLSLSVTKINPTGTHKLLETVFKSSSSSALLGFRTYWRSQFLAYSTGIQNVRLLHCRDTDVRLHSSFHHFGV